MRRANLEAHTFRALQVGNDPKELAGGRISTRAKHLVKSFYVDFGMRCQLWKTHRGIDVITQQFFAEGHLAGKKAFNGLAKKTLPKGGIALRACLNRFPEISRQSHV
jgi:hypothetical protein